MRNSMLYGYPMLGRFGLGHSMLAWARCAVWCEREGVRMIGPRWFQPRIGPYLRRERDKRAYHLLFDNNGYIGDPCRTFLLNSARIVCAESELPERGFAPGASTVVVFRNAVADNERKHFHEVRGHGAFLHAQLTRITRPAFRPPDVTGPFIAVHVRMGDFTRISSAADIKPGVHNTCLPIEWYGAMIGKLRAAFGSDLPVRLFSDGSDAELSSLLALPGLERSPKQASVTDMLSIAKGAVLVASASGFSLWGAFLGGLPRICFPGQLNARTREEKDFDLECGMNDALSAPFLAHVGARLGRSPA